LYKEILWSTFNRNSLGSINNLLYRADFIRFRKKEPSNKFNTMGKLVQLILWVIIGGILFAFSSQVFSIEFALFATLTNLLFLSMPFYVNALFLFPKFYSVEKSTKYFLLNISFSFIVALILAIIDNEILSQYAIVPRRAPNPFLFSLFRSVFWLALVQMFASTILIQNKLKENIATTKVITEEKLGTELKLLRAQINPHFLFNALNNIFSLAYAKSDKAPESILKLSGMLRYVIEDCANDEVFLSSELEYIQNYISFQEMKTPNDMNVAVSFPASVSNLKISPLLFIPFIENGFKYSKIEEYPDAYLNISIVIENKNTIVYTMQNSIPKDNKALPGTGKGIENVKQRLKILYENRHSLEINQTDEMYSVKLSVVCRS